MPTGSAAAPIRFEWLEVGACRHLECVTQRGGRWQQVRFPCHVGLIEHPDEGLTLFDTGYAPAFMTATERFPERLYRLVTPVDLPADRTLLAQLRLRGYEASDVRRIVLSHLHADHVAGLVDFPRARIVVMQAELASLRARSRWNALCHAYLPILLPRRGDARFEFIEAQPLVPLPSWMAPFGSGFDLIGDRSLLAVPLPGHTAGQVGLFLTLETGHPVFLVADACWSMGALREGRRPMAIASLLFDDRTRYRETFDRLRTLARRESRLQMLPSHCGVSALRFVDEIA